MQVQHMVAYPQHLAETHDDPEGNNDFFTLSLALWGAMLNNCRVVCGAFGMPKHRWQSEKRPAETTRTQVAAWCRKAMFLLAERIGLQTAVFHNLMLLCMDLFAHRLQKCEPVVR
jgi:hypothetical protein